jgi:inorganic triphosphatase YgiF
VTTTVRETERKYEAADGVELPGWSGLAGVEALIGPDEQTLEAVYYDTGDLRLARAGATLRRRRGGNDAGWHLTLPVGSDSGDGDSWDEVRVSAAGAGRRRNPSPPAELVGLTRVFTRGEPLGPVAELATTRRRWRLTDRDGRVLIEVVDDHVTGHTLGAFTSGLSWREVEVELGGDGDPDLLNRVEKRLLKAGVRRSDAQSKLARLLGDRLPEPVAASRAARRSTVGEATTGPTTSSSGNSSTAWVNRVRRPAVRQDAYVRRTA